MKKLRQLLSFRPPTLQVQQVLVVCHTGDVEGMAVAENICVGAEFAKVGFAMLDIGRQTAWPALETFGAVVLCTEQIWRLGPAVTLRLQQFVAAGGGLLVAYRGWNDDLAELFGMDRKASEPRMRSSCGLSVEREIFPGSVGLRVDNPDWVIDHSSFDIRSADLAADCSVLVRDLEEQPIAWSRPHDHGCLIYWNTGVLHARALRGFAMQTLLGTMKVGVAAAAGFAMFHVDDFPTSLSDARPEPIATEFPDLNWDDFFFGVWHRDMMKLRAKHELTYTWYVVMDYDDVDNSPGATPDAAATASARRILELRFNNVVEVAPDDEYGFHGYNHEPLVTDSWPDIPTLEEKLEIARSLWDKIVPAPFPTSWVPANNWYHPKHMRAVKRAFPELSTVCSVFSTGEFEFGEAREFGREPWEDALLCLPRETYGYVLAPAVRMMMLSQIAGMGVWTHFVHPDDIFDIPATPAESAYRRNPNSLMWRTPKDGGELGMFDQLDAWLSEVRSTYSWLEFVTTSEAERRYCTHSDNQVQVFTGNDVVQITATAGSCFYVRTREETSLTALTGGEVLDRRRVDGGKLNIVKCPTGSASFRIVSDHDE